MSEERPIRTYTYRRLKRSGWNQEDPGSHESKEEVIEEIVTSPEEVPKPFPSGEERRPDVIVFQQVGTKFRFIHEAYRDEETEHWRVETLRRNPEQMVRPSERGRSDWSFRQGCGTRLDEHPVTPGSCLSSA